MTVFIANRQCNSPMTNPMSVSFSSWLPFRFGQCIFRYLLSSVDARGLVEAFESKGCVHFDYVGLVAD